MLQVPRGLLQGAYAQGYRYDRDLLRATRKSTIDDTMPRRFHSVATRLVSQSQDAALTGVQVFNNPQIKFKSETFIVLMNIAWTSQSSLPGELVLDPFYGSGNAGSGGAGAGGRALLCDLDAGFAPGRSRLGIEELKVVAA